MVKVSVHLLLYAMQCFTHDLCGSYSASKISGKKVYCLFV